MANDLTGPLNISLLEWAAIPVPIFGALDRRAVTPFTLSRSDNVAACVSIVPWTSTGIAVGAMIGTNNEIAPKIA